MPVIKIVVQKGNHQVDKKVQQLDFCCPFAYFKLRVRPQDTIGGLARELGVCRATIKYNRAKLRDGQIKCHRRDACLAGLWLSDHKIKEMEEQMRLEEHFKKGNR